MAGRRQIGWLGIGLDERVPNIAADRSLFELQVQGNEHHGSLAEPAEVFPAAPKTVDFKLYREA